MEGIKYDQDKTKWELLPWDEVEEVVEVLMLGAKKYAPDNWKVVPHAKNRYFDASIRHILSAFNGEIDDSETGKQHLAHAVCCLLFWMWHNNDTQQHDELRKALGIPQNDRTLKALSKTPKEATEA